MLAGVLGKCPGSLLDFEVVLEAGSTRYLLIHPLRIFRFLLS